MFYWRSCLTGRHVFHKNVSYGRTCLIGGHVIQVYMSSGAQVWQEDMSYERSYLTVKHEGRYVLHDVMCCEVLVDCDHIFFQVHTEILKILLKVRYPCRSCNQLYICCCEFRQLLFFFSSNILFALSHAFPEIFVYNIFLVFLGII